MKVLVVALTSYDIDLLERLITSIQNQYPVNFEYDTKIVVNTLKKNYYKQVTEHFKNKYEIIQTESNGHPGKGHNSVINLFKERTQYTHLIMIDGDDLFYPCAFQQIIKAYDNNIDVLHLMLNDYVTFIDKKIRHTKLNGKFKLYSSFDDEQNWWQNINVKNPFLIRVDLCKTPSRMIFFSRKIFNADVKIEYDEECTLYDDYLAFLSLCENHFNKSLNIATISNSYIYCYNALNPESASRQFKEKDTETEIFRRKALKYPLSLKNFGNEQDLDLKMLKFLKLETPNNYNLEKKKEFCNKNVIEWEVRHKFKKANQYFLNKDYKNARIHYSILTNSGTKSLKIFFNLGIIYYFEKNYKAAIGCFIEANEIKPTFDTYKNLFIVYKELNNVDKQIEYIQKAIKIKDSILLRTYLFNLLPYQQITKKNIILKFKSININPYPKPILCYYTGYSDPFNGKNYEERNVYGSEIASIKLCEQFTDKYKVFVFCVCREEITHNNVHYFNISKYEEFQQLYPIEILIVSRFIHFFIEFRCLAKKVYYLLHDARVHNYWKHKNLIDCGNPIFHNLITNLNKIICVSPWHKKYFCNFVKIPDNYVEIIPNGFEPKNFEVDFAKKKKNRFIYCSDPNRGLIILLKMFPKILEKFPDATLDIFFHKIENPTILELINNLGNNVQFKGKLKQSELAKELCKSDVWFYPNLYSHETFCLCALEAMAGGNLVIARKYSGLISTINDGGILIDEHSPDKFMSKSLKIIFEILSDEKRKRNYQNLAIQRANLFQWTKVSKMWYSLFEN